MSSGRRADGEGSAPFYDETRRKWTVGFRYVDELGRHKRKWLRADSEEDARKKLRKALTERDAGMPIPDDKLTLKHYLQDWLADAKRAEERRATTLRGYSVNVDHICASSIASVRLNQLRPTHIRTLRQELAAKGLGARSVTYVGAVLRVALGDAVELELLVRNPAQVPKRVGRKRGSQQEPGFEVVPLTTEQVEAFFTAIRDEPLEALFVMAVTCGLRRGELLGLRWSDINLRERSLRVRYQIAEARSPDGARRLELQELKTATSRRHIDLSDVVVAHLLRHRERQAFERHGMANLWQERDLVFCNDLGGPIETTTLYRVWDRVRQRAQITVRFHDLRHTTASLLLAAGMPLWEVSRVLGHANQAFTANIYGHLYPEQRRTAADIMQRLFGSVAGGS